MIDPKKALRVVDPNKALRVIEYAGHMAPNRVVSPSQDSKRKGSHGDLCVRGLVMGMATRNAFFGSITRNAFFGSMETTIENQNQLRMF